MKTYQKRLSKICAIILGILIVIYGAIFLVCKIYLSPAHIKEMIVKQARSKFNRTITVGDDITLTVNLNMSPHLILHDVTVSNSKWASNPYIFKAQEIEFHFDLLAILLKNITIKSITFIAPEVFLEINSRHNNWQDLKNDMQSTPSSSNMKTEVRKISLDRGKLTYNEDKVLLDKLTLAISDHSSQYHLHLEGSHDNLPLKATIDVDDMNDYFKLDLVNLQIAHSDIEGKLKIEGEPSRISGEFHSDRLFLTDFSSGHNNDGGEYKLSDAPLPINMLRDAQIDVKAKFGEIDLAGLKLKNVNIKVANEKNVVRAIIQPAANLVNGKFNFSMAYDINPQTPRLTVAAKTSTLDFAQVLHEMLGKSPISQSTLDFDANLNGRGDNLRSIVGSLGGKILLKVGPGEFLNSNAGIGNVFANVLTSVITFEKDAPSSSFTCGVMNFSVNNGVANAKQGIGIEAANVNVLGNGMVDLRNGRIEFSMIPQNKLSANPVDLAGFSVAQLVSVKGTISKPQTTLNPVNLLQQGTTALLEAGMAGSLSGLAPILAGSSLLNKTTKDPDASPCKTALGAN